MATKIDERVVSMQFDNKNFEKNVSQSMSTLDQLKEKLNFKGASKGLDELNGSMKGLDLNPLTSALTIAGEKFSALEQIGIGALRRIGEQAIDTATKLVKSLSVDNISAGWEKFGQKTTSVATLSSQGYDLDTVNEQLERLNWFTDETSYNFTDMVAEIGKFTAAGQGLEESVTAMQGIASWAALSGQNAATASRAMYQLSQAMGSGVMRKEDYKSIQNASMDTQEFREKALEAGVALGTLKKNADGTFESIVEGVSEGAFTMEQFADHLTQDKWFTSDVMMAVYKDYGKAATTIMAYVDKYADDTEHQISTASEAMDDIEAKAKVVAEEMVAAGQFENVDAAMDAALTKVSLDEIKEIPEIYDKAIAYKDEYNQSLIDDYNKNKKAGQAAISTVEEAVAAGLNPIIEIDDALIDMGYGLDQFSLKALRAGQEARTFADVLDSVKDAVSTGWMNTFQNIFGDYDEAKVLWTDLANELYDVFAEGGNQRNSMLAAWKELGGRNLLFANIDEETGALWNLFYALTDIINVVKEAFRDIFPPMTAEKLLDLTKKFKDFTERIRLNEEQLSNLKRVFSGLFAAMDLIIRGVVAVVKGFSPLKELFDAIAGLVYDLVTKFADWALATDETAKKMGTFEKIASTVSKVIQKIVDIIFKFVNVIRDLSEAFAHLFTANTSNLDGFGSKFEERFSKLVVIGQKVMDRFGAIGDIFKKLYDKMKPVLEAIGNAVSSAFDNLIGVFSGSVDSIDVNDIVNAIETGLGAAGVLGIKKIIDTIKGSVSELFGLKSIFEPIAGAFDGLKGVLKAYQNDLNAEIIMKIAKAVAILAASLLVLSLIEPSKLKSAITSLTTLFADLIGSFIVLERANKKSKFMNMVAIGAAFEEIAIAMLILSAAMTQIAKLSWEDIGKSLSTMAVVLQILPDALNKTNAKGATKKALAMILLSTSLVILSAALKSMAEMSWEEIGKSLSAMAISLQVLPATLNNIETKGAFKKALSMILLSTSLVILAEALKSMAELSWEEIGKSLSAMAISMLILPSALNSVETKGTLRKAVSMILLSTSLVILANAMKSIGEMSWEGIGKALAAMAIALQILPAVLNAINVQGAIRKALSMILLTTSLLILASYMDNVSKLSWEDIGKAMAAMAIALFVMCETMNMVKTPSTEQAVSLTIVASLLPVLANYMKSVSDISWEGIGKGLAAMFVSLGLMVLTLNLIKEQGIIKKAAAILIMSVALGSMALSLKLLSSIGWAGLLVGLVALVGLFGALWIGAKILGPMTGNILKLSISILSISVSMAIFGASMLAVGAGLIAIGTGLTIIGTSMPIIASGLAALVPVLVEQLPILISGVAQAIVQSAPDIAEAVNATIAALLDVVVESAPAIVSTLFEILKLILESLSEQIPDIVKTLFEFVDNILTTLVDNLPSITEKLFTVIIGLLDALVTYAPQIIDKLITIIIDIIHGLSVRMPDVVNAVLEFVQSLFSGLLSLIGGLIGTLIGEIAEGIATAIADGLPHIGEKLSEFSETIQPFLDMTSGISEDSMRGVQILASTILAIVAAEFISGITDFLSIFGGSTSEEFGEKIVEFGRSMVEFADVTKDIDAEQVAKSAIAAKALADFANNLPKEGGLWQKIAGTGDLAKFSEELKAFAPAFVDYANKIVEIKDMNAIAASAMAAKSLADFANNLPKHGGIWQEWVGDSTLKTFADELNAFAPALVDYATKVKGLDGAVIENSTKAATCIKEFATNLPPHDGLVQKFTGDATLSSFAEEMKAFAPALVEYANIVKGLDVDVVTKSTAAAETLSALEAGLPDQGGVVSWFAGDNTLETFAKELPNLAIGLKGYADNLGTNFDSSIVTSSVAAAQALADLQKALPDTGGVVSWFAGDNTITEFAKGLDTFGTNFASYYESVKGIDADVVRTVTESTSGLVDICKQMKFVDTNSMYYFTDAFNALAEIGIDKFVESFTNSKERVETVANDFVSTFNLTVVSQANKDKVKYTFETLCDSAYFAVEGKEEAIAQEARYFIQAFVDAVAEKNQAIITLFKNMTNNGIRQVKNKQSEFKDVGKMFVDGFISGINENKIRVDNAAKEIGSNALKALKESIDSHSPSKETARLGSYFGEGFIDGVNEYLGMSEDAGSGIGTSATDALREALEKSASLFDTSIDLEPTIKPVVDLTNVIAGAEQINGIFDTTRSVALAGSVSAAMNESANIQNSITVDNSDIIKSIDSLNTNMLDIADRLSKLEVRMDTGALVGELVMPMDSALGSRTIRRGRG